MLLIQPLGSIKADIQKLIMPKITVFSNSIRPAKNMSLTDQAWNHLVIEMSNGVYSEIFSFRVIRGRPRYLMGNLPEGNP